VNAYASAVDHLEARGVSVGSSGRSSRAPLRTGASRPRTAGVGDSMTAPLTASAAPMGVGALPPLSAAELGVGTAPIDAANSSYTAPGTVAVACGEGANDPLRAAAGPTTAPLSAIPLPASADDDLFAEPVLTVPLSVTDARTPQQPLSQPQYAQPTQHVHDPLGGTSVTPLTIPRARADDVDD